MGRAMATENGGNEPDTKPTPPTTAEPPWRTPSQDGEGEEGRRPKGLSAPMKVSKEEREEHERTHTPYRAWCPVCVRARGRATPHMKSKEAEEEAVPKISMDYFFMSSKDEEAKENPLIVMMDEETGEKYARAVGHKGVGTAGERDWLVKDMDAEMKAWGHQGGVSGHIIMKSDGEPAVVARRNAVAGYHGGRVSPEAPAKGESQSNGRVEEAGKTVREFARVLKEQIEEKADMEIDSGMAIVLWLVRWAVMLVSRYLVGKDGRTAYERRTGRKCRVPVVPFGEKVWYKEIRETKERKEKFCSEWREGIWLGHQRSSNEALVGTNRGVVKAYSVKRREPDQRWSKEAILGMVGTPQQPDPTKPGTKIPIRVSFDAERGGEPVPSELPKDEAPVRRMRFTPGILEKFGYTEGCPGCKMKKAGLEESRNHSEGCRERIAKELAKEEEGREKLRKEAERINGWMAENGEIVDKEAMPEPPRDEPEEVEMEDPDGGLPEPLGEQEPAVQTTKPEPLGEQAASEGSKE